MKVVFDYPPNIDLIREVLTPKETAVFTYGDTMYAPTGKGEPSEDLVAHEETHTRQQGNDPETWWKKYLTDPTFRLEQELEAYQNQYKKYCELQKDRNRRVRFLIRISGDLSSAMYGRLITSSEAMKLIKGNIK